MSIKRERIGVDQLAIGMYVCELDRPWTETPFLFQGFYIKGRDEIQELKKYCRHVFIDKEYARLPNATSEITGETLIAVPNEPPKGKASSVAQENPSLVVYEDTVPVLEEVEVGEQIHEDMTAVVYSMIDAARDSRKLDAVDLQRVVDVMVDSVLRNPNALMWLMRLKQKDSYTHSHAVNTAILAAGFGRHLGLGREGLRTLALGSMLIDIGKAKLPTELLMKQGTLSGAEFELLRQHVGFSLQILEGSSQFDGRIMELVQAHHEHFDGTGYPQGWKGPKIPISARIASIVDAFDSMTSDRPYRQAVSPHKAISAMWHLRDSQFQKELIESFIEFIGAYPVGTLVELTTGEVGVVASQSRGHRLRPKVKLILDRDKKPLEFNPFVDLWSEMKMADGKPLAIVRALDPGAYDVGPIG